MQFVLHLAKWMKISNNKSTRSSQRNKKKKLWFQKLCCYISNDIHCQKWNGLNQAHTLSSIQMSIKCFGKFFPFIRLCSTFNASTGAIVYCKYIFKCPCEALRLETFQLCEHSQIYLQGFVRDPCQKAARLRRKKSHKSVEPMESRTNVDGIDNGDMNHLALLETLFVHFN